MAFGQPALCKRATKLELKESKTIRLDPTFVLALEAWLLDVYAVLRPRPSDYEQRRRLVQDFNVMATNTFGNNSGFPCVEAFGSFVMDLFTAGSDLDLSINFSNDYTTEIPRDKKISVLRRFIRSLYALQKRGYFCRVSPILRARVPVVKVVDCGTGIECDISAENKDGVSRSWILTIVSSIDARFQILSYLMKTWAKAHDINSSKDRTMNSLSIISLVAFHLQTRDPPILPPFSALFKDGTDVSSIENVVVGFKHFGRRNEESIAELFLTLFIKLSAVESLWQQGLCASTFEGSWIYKEWESGVGNMSVEDFLDRSQNFARSVGKAEMKKIYNCIKGSLKLLSRFLEGQIEETKLKARLFGSIPSNVSRDHLVSKEQRGIKRSIPFHESSPINPITAKRARYIEATEGHHDFHETPTNLPNPSIPVNQHSGPFQPSYGVRHLNPSFVPPQSGYGPEYHPQPPIGPHPGYGSQYHPHPPIASHSGYGSQYHPQPPIAPHSGYGSHHHPFTPQSGYEIEHRRPPPVPYQLSSGLEHHQSDRNLMPPKSRHGGHENLWYGYSTQDLGHPRHPFVPPRQVFGPDYP